MGVTKEGTRDFDGRDDCGKWSGGVTREKVVFGTEAAALDPPEGARLC